MMFKLFRWFVWIDIFTARDRCAATEPPGPPPAPAMIDLERMIRVDK
jgi:hypothetical protein